MKRILFGCAFYLSALIGIMLAVIPSPKDQDSLVWVVISMFVSLLGVIILWFSLRAFTYATLIEGDLDVRFNLI
ncbi:MAG: hypothetical protein A2836_00050 [Candidatus Taylorbacteria bacterium RIFCSPHIGHO2_01_FULL_45_63]|uniref:DUF5671 domain-containing protein n=1 Tax=Candidatus Taylorbacteria bacterium RIFCSPHIGHO2_02_FULL_45_35 TaxID=1802311 RepID=A0A1G2MVA7_9BACT|nr:MAG: hypothetical protein A2836_00050 [Candidatus Taylorbacteria bacterium RIFCSPHIGHO2_01_FULL_45_63]OHA27209.1 MAG: hypothetical protein A3D56_02005 [Candidatus Taylorbacteria bacterium RIFCSPHIGHO2_02_FULL_45_35]OHA33703.1 MAG: hypothetical protein A3A22_03940 [Candidatus Taylorbacteria bacterium RIFCSPLOWO2_01_FULL_45_34b]